jgi:hypothetical protein
MSILLIFSLLLRFVLEQYMLNFRTQRCNVQKNNILILCYAEEVVVVVVDVAPVTCLSPIIVDSFLQLRSEAVRPYGSTFDVYV